MEEKFKLKLSDWTKVPVETALMLYNQSNDYLDYTFSLSEKITQRAYTFSVIVIAAIGALFGKLLSIEITSSFDCALFWLLSFSILALFVIAFIIAKLVFPFSLIQKGRRPKIIGEQQYLAPEKMTKEQSYLNYVLGEIEENQNKIDYNTQINSERLSLLRKLIIVLLLAFPFFLVCYILIFSLCQ